MYVRSSIKMLFLLSAVFWCYSHSAQVTKSDLGFGYSNLSGVAYYSSDIPFCDVFKTAKRWEQCADGGCERGGIPESHLDKNGWITSFPAGINEGQAYIFTHNGEYYPLGNYTLTWTGGANDGNDIRIDGSGATVVSEDLSGEVKKRVYAIQRTENWGFKVIVTSTTIKNIHCWLPGLEGGDPNGYKSGNPELGPSMFTPWFKDNVRPFSVIRFMEWVRTNHSDEQYWHERKPESHAFYDKLSNDEWAKYDTKGSVPWEIIIDLCNELNADPWLCIPHQANDEYLASLATLVHERLKPGLKVWLEYTNEHWNGGFQQNWWIFNNKSTLCPPSRYNGDPHLDMGYASRAMDIWNAFSNRFGSMDRVVRVAAGAWPGSLDTYHMVSGFKCDVAAITGYIGGHDSPNYLDNGTSVWALLNRNMNALLSGSIKYSDMIDSCILQSQPRLKASWTQTINHAAQKYNLPMVAYEAGSHINSPNIPSSTQMTNVLKNLHADPKFYDYQKKAMQDWIDIGGRGYTMYVATSQWSEHGCWGHKQYYNQPTEDAPRYKAFIDVMKNDPNYGDRVTDPGTRVSSMRNQAVTAGLSPLRINKGSICSGELQSNTAELFILDLHGRLIRSFEVKGNQNIPLPFLSSGTYVVVLNGKHETFSQAFFHSGRNFN